jgi:hypothetical protein
MINKRSKLIQNAGEYANFTQVKTCNLEPNVDQYKVPCTTLNDNQFGFKDIVGYYSGGKKISRQSRRRSIKNQRQHHNHKGGCGSSVTDCMGNKISNMGDMTHLSTASEQAWFSRNVYGAPNSTNDIPQKGGRNNKSIRTSQRNIRRKLNMHQ